MSIEGQKTSNLAVITSANTNDRIVVVSNTSGNTQTTTISVGNLFGNSNVIVKSSRISTPANSSAANVAQGGIYDDGTYLYIATANNTLKRVALSSF